MFIKILISYILGYVRIKVEGYYIERFINICISKKILIWNIKREKSSIMYANIGLKDFRDLKPIAKKTKCKVNIKRKKGLPFVLNRYKKRKIFAAFLIIILLGIAFSSKFIWNIEIKIESENITKEEIIADLKECGLDVGVQKKKINTKEIINLLRLKRNDISWAGIAIEGTNAIVQLVEAHAAPEIVDNDDYCNIIATKPGIITNIVAQNGTALVKVGDLVQEGTMLIGGWLEGKYTGTRYVHSIGKVEARVWYSEKTKIFYNQQVKEQTGMTESKYSVKLNNFQINFYKTLSKFEIYDTIEEEKKLQLFSNFYLPISLMKITNYEQETKEIKYDIEQAKSLGITQAKEKLNEKIENKENLVNEVINYYEEDDGITVEVIYEVVENIGTNEKIVF